MPDFQASGRLFPLYFFFGKILSSGNKNACMPVNVRLFLFPVDNGFSCLYGIFMISGRTVQLSLMLWLVLAGLAVRV